MNNAHRLHAILKLAHAQPEGIRIMQVWAKVFDVDQENLFEIHRGIVTLHRVSQEIQQSLKLIEGINQDLFLEPFDSIDRVIIWKNLNGNWAECKQVLTGAELKGLEHCAHELDKYEAEQPLDGDALTRFAEEVGTLFDDILNSNLNGDLKRTLLRLLESMRRAIAEYHILGTHGLKETLAMVVGELMLLHDDMAQEEELDEGRRSVLRRFCGLASRLKDLVEIGYQCVYLAQFFRPDLLPETVSVPFPPEPPVDN